MDFEHLVERVYKLAGVMDPDEVMRPSTLARRILGPRSVIKIETRGYFATTAIVDGAQKIIVKRGLSEHRAEHVIGHELGHLVCDEEGYDEADLEAACDFIGAGIITRRRPFASVARSAGNDFKQLAFDFATTETLVARRTGEVLGTPIIVVTPHTIYASGDERELPHDAELRALASARKRHPLVERIPLTDDRRRTALLMSAA